MSEEPTQLMMASALRAGHEIHWYVIEKVLGQGGFGITYLAYDKNLDQHVAIKEYLPTFLSYRDDTRQVKPLTQEHSSDFQWGLEGFLTEARTLAKFDHPNIVGVKAVFEENNTAYIVMDYEQGENLAVIYRQRGCVEQPFLEELFFPIFDGLGKIHDMGFIHRDIKPSNIYLRADGTPVLIDFGSARQMSTGHTQEMTTLISQGYTPLEQYSANYGKQGPWTDIYALASTIHEGITGAKPAESLGRSANLMRGEPDPVLALSQHSPAGFDASFLAAVDQGLALQPEARPVDLNRWGREFGIKSIQPAPVSNKPRTGDPLDTQSALEEPTKLFVSAHTGAAHAPSSAMPADGSGQQTGIATPAQVKAKKTSLPGLISVFVLIGAAVGAYYWYSPDATVDRESESFVIEDLPHPGTPVAIELPRDLVLQKLDVLSRQAVVYRDAFELDSNNPQVISGVSTVNQELLDVLRRWNVQTHTEVAQQVELIAQTLPEVSGGLSAVEDRLSDTASGIEMDEILELVTAGHIVYPEGASVIDHVGRLNTADFNALSATDAWKAMMVKLKRAAVEKVSNAAFDDAARLVEAGLTLDSADPQFDRLKQHLSGTP